MSNNYDFEINQLRIDSGQPLPKVEKQNKKLNKNDWIYKPGPGEKFLRGPLPWEWLLLAAQGKGRAMQVAVALWFQAGLNKAETVSLNQSRLLEMGVTRDSARRGLRELEKWKLVSVVRRAGRKPVVTILLKQQKGN